MPPLPPVRGTGAVWQRGHADGGECFCKTLHLTGGKLLQHSRGGGPYLLQTDTQDETQVDHIIRKRDGGGGAPPNGQVLCARSLIAVSTPYRGSVRKRRSATEPVIL